MKLHTFADRAVASLFRRVKLFRGGFGDARALERRVARVEAYASEARPERIEIAWGPSTLVNGGLRRVGVFESPTKSDLPRESWKATVELTEPAAGTRGPIAILLAATAEEGFFGRRRLARALHSQGIATLLLENPFYGSRRPEGQFGAAVGTVAEQFAMNLATVDEARALTMYLVDRGHTKVGLTGYSQGGFMAAFAAATLDLPVAVVPRGAGSDASNVFLDGALSLGIDWKRLASDRGSLASARAELARCLGSVRVNRLPPPRCPEAAIIVSARHDGFVLPSEAEVLAEHWKGSELRWSSAGHVTSLLFDAKLHQSAIVDAFSRLPSR